MSPGGPNPCAARRAVGGVLRADLGERRVRVHQDGVAHRRRPRHGLGRGGRHPRGRPGLLDGLGEHLDVVEVPEPAVERQPLVGPCRQDDLHGFAEAGGGLVARDAERLELGALEAPAGAPVETPAGEVVEHGDLLRQSQRVVEGGQRHGRADADPPGAVRRLQRHQVDRRADAVGREVVLCQPHGVVARLVHRHDPLHRPLVHRVQRHASLRPTEELEHPDLHGPIVRTATGPPTSPLLSAVQRARRGARPGGGEDAAALRSGRLVPVLRDTERPGARVLRVHLRPVHRARRQGHVHGHPGARPPTSARVPGVPPTARRGAVRARPPVLDRGRRVRPRVPRPAHRPAAAR